VRAGEVHRVQHIGDARRGVVGETHGGVLQHLVRVREVRAVERGYADLVRVRGVLDVLLAVVDGREGHAVLAVGVEPCDEALRVDDALDGLHVLPVAEERAGVRAAERQKAHGPVPVVEDEVAAVQVLHLPQDREGVFSVEVQVRFVRTLTGSERPAGVLERVGHRDVGGAALKVCSVSFTENPEVVERGLRVHEVMAVPCSFFSSVIVRMR
jgi:hypothetical protein